MSCHAMPCHAMHVVDVWMYGCMYVHMYVMYGMEWNGMECNVCMHVMYVCLFVCLSVCMYVCNICMHVRM